MIAATRATDMVHCSELPRVHTRGNVKKYVDIVTQNAYEKLYDAKIMGDTMENIYATSCDASRYETAKANIVNVSYLGDFTLDMLFRMMNIREAVDERMAMEIAGIIQLYLPQRSFTKVPITVNSVDIEGKPVKKVLEVKLYYAYEADAVQWLIMAFFNRSDLIEERYRKMNAMVSPYEVLYALKDDNHLVNTLFFGTNVYMNIQNHIIFQNEIMSIRFPSGLELFWHTHTMSDLEVYSCAGIFTMYIERFTSNFSYCS